MSTIFKENSSSVTASTLGLDILVQWIIEHLRMLCAEDVKELIDQKRTLF
ncbi:hypothetical protein [Candidatus Doolittlea endobia]|nr:hypothetical protein [Candidatus Doolittlea endobia]